VQKLIHQWLLQHHVHMNRVLHSCCKSFRDMFSSISGG